MVKMLWQCPPCGQGHNNWCNIHSILILPALVQNTTKNGTQDQFLTSCGHVLIKDQMKLHLLEKKAKNSWTSATITGDGFKNLPKSNKRKVKLNLAKSPNPKTLCASPSWVTHHLEKRALWHWIVWSLIEICLLISPIPCSISRFKFPV